MLYSGKLPDGTYASTISSEIVSQIRGVHDVGSTAVGSFVESSEFQKAMKIALAHELFGTTSEATTSAQKIAIDEKVALHVYGLDLAGNRVSNSSLFDIASHKFVSENNGNWRIIAGESVDPNSVLIKSEIPALLEKRGNFTIDGVPRSVIGGTGTLVDQINHLAGQAILQTTASKVSATSLDGYMAMTPKAALDTLTAAENVGLRAIATQALNKLGWVGDILALALVARDANAAFGAGDAAKGKAIIRDGLSEIAGGLAGGLLAAQVVGSAVAPLYLTGPAGAVIASGLTLLAGFAGSIFGTHKGAEFSKSLSNFTSALRSAFGAAPIAASPLILDLDGDGVETIGQTHNVHFDHNGDGLAERTGWASKDDGLLVRDLDGDGTIDNGAELFGSNTLLASGQKAANGFEALRGLDGNNDGKIDSTDAVFAQLRIWKDASQDGITQDDELLTLEQASVASIGTGYTNQTVTDANGNQHLQAGSFTSATGQTGKIDDVWFSQDTARTVDISAVAETDAIKAMPELAGMGRVHSLHQTMARTPNPALESLLSQFAATTDEATLRQLTTSIIYQWTGVQNASPTSRGAYLGCAHAPGAGSHAQHRLRPEVRHQRRHRRPGTQRDCGDCPSV